MPIPPSRLLRTLLLAFALCGLLSAAPRRPPERPVNINTATASH